MSEVPSSGYETSEKSKFTRLSRALIFGVFLITAAGAATLLPNNSLAYTGTTADNDEARDYVDKANQALKEGDKDKQLKNLLNAVRRDPNYVSALHALGNMFFNQKEWNMAIHTGENALWAYRRLLNGTPAQQALARNVEPKDIEEIQELIKEAEFKKEYEANVAKEDKRKLREAQIQNASYSQNDSQAAAIREGLLRNCLANCQGLPDRDINMLFDNPRQKCEWTCRNAQ